MSQDDPQSEHGGPYQPMALGRANQVGQAANQQQVGQQMHSSGAVGLHHQRFHGLTRHQSAHNLSRSHGSVVVGLGHRLHPILISPAYLRTAASLMADGPALDNLGLPPHNLN